MTTYKQPVKELSRELIWTHAVESLTTQRDVNRILNVDYLENLWNFCQRKLDGELDYDVFTKWKEYADICYGKKRPQDLKIAFFCGNEPENDVKHLLNLGIRIENIYAFESENKLFKAAVDSLLKSHPLLKIYKGKIEEYAELQNTKFDIMYLDFTGPLTKEYKIMVKILDLNALTDMSILVVNTTYPDKTSKNIERIADFFYNDTFFEYSVVNGKERDKDSWIYRAEGCDALGIDHETLLDLIGKHFEQAYSAFQSSFLLDYANRHKPAYQVFKQRMLSSRIIKNDELKDIDKFLSTYYNPLLSEYFEDGRRLPSSQYEDDNFFKTKENGALRSRHESMKLMEVILESPYRHWRSEDLSYEKPKEEADTDTDDSVIDFKTVLTKEVSDVVNNIGDWFYAKYSFCDMPMEHLWLELLLNQFGHPYHTNIDNHRRYRYKAKERSMCIDILTLDKCRALYDWLPMLEYFIHDMKDHNRQMVTKMCIDAIDKQLLHIVEEAYFGAALVGIDSYEWSKYKFLPTRINLNEDERIKDSSENVE